jgi:AraC family transcriptional regulator, transcriptional activator of pobA
MRSSVSHFEIHCRSDYHFRCKEFVTPNRLDFYMVSIITGGEGIKTIGAQEYYLKRGTLCFVSPEQITSWQSIVDDHAGWSCVFTEDYLDTEYPFFKIDGNAVLELDESQLDYFTRFFEEIAAEYNGENPLKKDIIKAFLTIILKKAQGLGGIVTEDNSNAEQRLTMAFTRLFEQDFAPLRKQETICVKSPGAYARLLNVTQNHLNDTVRAVTGKSAGALIRERIIKEASQLLLHTTLDIAEIAFLLNIEDPSYFARFFKRYTGITPKQHREAV